MLGLLNIYGNYIKMAVCVVLLAGAWYSGYHFEHTRFVKFQDDVRATADKQAAQTASIQKQHELINRGIKNEYEGKLAAVKSFYSGMQLNPSSRAMPGISPAPRGTDAETAYPILARQCAETTLQVNLWQEWATENGLIK
jgi:hypothetical protein